MITDAALLTGMCGDGLCFLFYLCLQSLSVVCPTCQGAEEKSKRNLCVCLLLFLALFLAIMLVALCYAVTSWPIKTLTCYKMIS